MKTIVEFDMVEAVRSTRLLQYCRTFGNLGNLRARARFKFTAVDAWCYYDKYTPLHRHCFNVITLFPRFSAFNTSVRVINPITHIRSQLGDKHYENTH